MSLFVLTFWKTIAANERYYIISTVTHEKVVSRTLEWTENYPRKLTIQLDNRTGTATDNLISPSFAGWSAAAVGALDVGDRVNYTVDMTSDPGIETQVFWGIITEISQASGGTLTIIAKDYLEKYEYIQPSSIVYKNYRDLVVKNTSVGSGARSIDGCTETGIQFPAVFVGLALTDTRIELGDDAGSWGMDDHDQMEQAFVAEGNGLIGVHMHYTTIDMVGGSLHVSVQTDSGNIPSGIEVGYADQALGANETNTAFQLDWVTGHCPMRLDKGRKYWLVSKLHYTSKTTFTLYMSLTPDPDAVVATCNHWDDSLGTRTAIAHTVHARMDWADYQEVAPDNYYFDAAGTRIICRTDNEPVVTVDTYYTGTLYRGMVSYYYGTVTTGEIFTKLLTAGCADTYTVDSDCDTTYTLYQTRGKSVGECLRELCDTFETTGDRIDKQHIIAAYQDGGGLNVIKVGFRNNDTGRTFSHGADSTTDDEIRIASVNLKRTVNLRPASVVVIGKAAGGGPIIVQRDDRALATSFRTQSKLALTTTLTDESINTLADADRKAWQILDSYTRGAWEGSITVAGVFPDLFDLDTASESYGAGGHIDLNYSPLGIVSGTFHVKGIVLHENTTEIQISNEDVLMLNAFTESRGRAERSESFLAPDDPFTTVFVSGYYGSVEAAATMYMQLCVWDETPIDDHTRVLCTRTANSRYNDSTYHAEFEMNNGHTPDGDEVYQIELWDAVTGGDHHAKVTLTVSEQFPKWRTTRVIAEIHCKAAA